MSYAADVKPNISVKAEPITHQTAAISNGTGTTTAVPVDRPVDEELTISLPAEGGAAWAVKIPQFLYDQWALVREEGVLLGTMVVDSSSGQPKITIRIPKKTPPADPSSTAGTSSTSAKPEPAEGMVKAEDLAAWTSGYNTDYLPAEYEMNMHPDRARNLYVFKENKRDSVTVRDGALGKRKREKAFPTITNAIQHEGMLMTKADEHYERILANRRAENEAARRPVQHMEDYESQGRINQLSSGYAAIRSNFGSGLATSAREPVRKQEKQARVDRPVLRDRLFALFREKPYWNISVIKQQVNQPDVWLREVLKDVAEQVKEGPYRDYWQLKEALRIAGSGMASGGGEQAKGEQGEAKEEQEDEDEEDEEEGDESEFDEDDFEEVTGIKLQ